MKVVSLLLPLPGELLRGPRKRPLWCELTWQGCGGRQMPREFGASEVVSSQGPGLPGPFPFLPELILSSGSTV